MLNVPKFLYETTYDLVNAMVMYRPHWMPPRDPAEVRFWQESLRDCLTDATVEGKVWEWPATVLTVGAPPSSGPTEKGPTLGPLLECMAKEFFNEGRHHKGLLAFYQQQPRPNRYLPSMRVWNQRPQLARCQSIGRVLGRPAVVTTSLRYPDTRASCGSQAGQQGCWRRRNLPCRRAPPTLQPLGQHL